MPIRKLNTVSWWQISRSNAALFSIATTTLALAIVGSRSGFGIEVSLPKLAWAALSVFPLLGVVIIALFAKIQQRIDLKSSGDQFLHNKHSVEPDNRA